jgi:hypothetical protein
MLDFFLYLMYALLIGGIGAAVVFAGVNAAKSPGSSVKSLYGIGALVVVFVVAYAMSGDFVTTEQQAKGISGGTSKLIGAGLITFYMALVVSILGMVYSEISKALK